MGRDGTKRAGGEDWRKGSGARDGRMFDKVKVWVKRQRGSKKSHVGKVMIIKLACPDLTRAMKRRD